MDLRALPAILLFALAGCLGDPSADPARDGGEPYAGEGHGSSRVTSTQELGRASGTSLTPAQFAFTVTVPEGGARSVRWSLSVDGPGAPASRVEGPGCQAGGSVVVQVAAAGTSTYGGACSDLAPGEHAFKVVLATPAPAFAATVSGSVTQERTW